MAFSLRLSNSLKATLGNPKGTALLWPQLTSCSNSKNKLHILGGLVYNRAFNTASTQKYNEIF